MKRKIPSPLILLAALTLLAVSGWLYIYSCRDEVKVNLQTITGDPSCLSDKHFDIQCQTFKYSDYQKVWNVDIGFPSGPVLEKITYGSKPYIEEIEYRISLPYIFTESEASSYSFQIDSWNNSWSGLLAGLQVKDETSLIPAEYFPESNLTEHITIDCLTQLPWFIKMDGVIYFTLANYPYDLLTYKARYDEVIGGKHIDSETSLSYPVEYTAMSGIWVFDESSDAYPENVVPYLITSDSTSMKVYGIYAVEAESAIILLTIDNGVDLYATVYDTKTKTTHDPVLIFHSDSGDIEPKIIRENNTCPMGSIIVEIQNDESEWFALALGKNDITGNIEAVSYDIEQVIPMLVSYDYYDIDEMLTYTDIFYYVGEAWIISDVTNYWATSQLQLSLNSPNYPYSNLLAQKIRVVLVKEGAIFYEGLLEFDLAAADMESYLQCYINYDINDDNYDIHHNRNTTQIELH